MVGSPVTVNHYRDRLVKRWHSRINLVFGQRDELKEFLWSFSVLCLSVSNLSVFSNVHHKKKM